MREKVLYRKIVRNSLGGLEFAVQEGAKRAIRPRSPNAKPILARFRGVRIRGSGGAKRSIRLRSPNANPILAYSSLF
jgi:hypothetical protein